MTRLRRRARATLVRGVACAATRRWRRSRPSVGGPADWLIEPPDGEEIGAALARRASRTACRSRSSAADRTCSCPTRGVRGAGHSAARRRDRAWSTRDRVRADAAVTINGLVRWTINHGVRRPRGLGRHAGHGRRRDLRQRALRRPAASATWSTSVRLAGTRRDRASDVAPTAMEFGYDASRLQRDAARCCCRRRSRVGRGDPAALRAVARESLAFRKRTQPLDSPSAGCIFQNPQPGARRRARRHSAVGRRARRSRRAQGRVASAARASRRRTATSSSTTAAPRARDIRALIERCRDGGARAVRRRPARRRSCV